MILFHCLFWFLICLDLLLPIYFVFYRHYVFCLLFCFFLLLFYYNNLSWDFSLPVWMFYVVCFWYLCLLLIFLCILDFTSKLSVSISLLYNDIEWPHFDYIIVFSTFYMPTSQTVFKPPNHSFFLLLLLVFMYKVYTYLYV